MCQASTGQCEIGLLVSGLLVSGILVRAILVSGILVLCAPLCFVVFPGMALGHLVLCWPNGLLLVGLKAAIFSGMAWIGCSRGGMAWGF